MQDSRAKKNANEKILKNYKVKENTQKFVIQKKKSHGYETEKEVFGILGL